MPISFLIYKGWWNQREKTNFVVFMNAVSIIVYDQWTGYQTYVHSKNNETLCMQGNHTTLAHKEKCWAIEIGSHI